ncbi:putative Protein-S-isoprenylcysteine O-methyltransferase B [Blattamonas nauphoetae]|uniref:Protein-S-isoprenylcysteine O-methyltransferase n=1 Tax=Blattamonas nauphoetae TaxID=2049346 RepID=A0ABQ9Y4A6_9EUKA|nr:putative Protein-S-isoprenylcysteine O-methyltransferase B [Blattamonas nauphoetae]
MQLQVIQLIIFSFFIVFFFVSEHYLERKYHPYDKPQPLLTPHFAAAIIGAFLEHIIEMICFPGLKQHSTTFFVGLILTILGDLMRKTGIITLGRNFTLKISTKKRDEHELVTHGIYSKIRNPSYTGWYIWTVGSQIMLCNPVCTILFTGICWFFFADRIKYEDAYLQSFFKEQFEEYKNSVWSGIPFVP